MNNLKVYTYGFLLIALGLLGSTTYGHAQQSEEEIKQLLEQRDQQIKELMGPKGTDYTQKQRQELKDIINEIMDYEAMAQYALQETYDTLSTEQRTEFVDLFSTVIRDQSLSNLNIYRAEVTYNNISVNSDSATVETMAQLENVRTPVVYHMDYDSQEGQWRVTDMIIDEVSTAGSYRRQFQSIINRKGYEYLLETLRKRSNR